MNHSIKLITVILLIIASLNNSFAQNTDPVQPTIYQTINLGYPVYIFDAPDLGLYVGYNLHSPVSERIAAEGQLSFSFSRFDRDDNLFSHDGGEILSGNALAGARFYFAKSDKNIRPYINFLAGYNYIKDTEFSDSVLITRTHHRLGISASAYIQINNRFNIGGGYESIGDLVLKVGYIF